jgi:hypothetical protein
MVEWDNIAGCLCGGLMIGLVAIVVGLIVFGTNPTIWVMVHGPYAQVPDLYRTPFMTAWELQFFIRTAVVPTLLVGVVSWLVSTTILIVLFHDC